MKFLVVSLALALSVSGCKFTKSGGDWDETRHLHEDLINRAVIKAAFVAKVDSDSSVIMSNRLSYVRARIQTLGTKVQSVNNISLKQSYIDELTPLQSESTNASFGLSGYDSVAIFEHYCPGGERSDFVAICKPAHEQLELVLVCSAPRSSWTDVRTQVVKACTNALSVPANPPPKVMILFGSIFDEQGNATNAVLLSHLCAGEFLQQR